MAIRPKPTDRTRLELYAASRYLGLGAEKELWLQVPFDVYLQDPLVALEDPKFGFDKSFRVRWEPGLGDGPTSARFAVVDYNGDTGQVYKMANWDEEEQAFLEPEGAGEQDLPRRILNRETAELMQFHQVNVWAILQRALDFFESGKGLGRRIPWGFPGNRLIVVPHAGYGKNAFYDRSSKSLQFYYFDTEGDGQTERVYTCLSTDIINHEFGHAILDGIRPYLIESASTETAAFHEFVGDLTAVLILLRNTPFRHSLAEQTGGDLAAANYLHSVAEQFGQTVKGRPYLRSAMQEPKLRMADVADNRNSHYVSQVLTGAMFDILLGLAFKYSERGQSPKEAFWHAIDRMQRTAIQPLDLLPPVDVTFRDYAHAVLRAEELSNPADPHAYRELMLDVFVDRGILAPDEVQSFKETRYLYDRLHMDVYHDVDDLSRSRAAAYRFLDDNRRVLYIPNDHDVIVVDLYDANKATRQGQRLPRQVILVYLWRESLTLEGDRFGKLQGSRTTVPCGGTLVFDQNGRIVSWSRKPGIHVNNGRRVSDELAAGEKRRKQILANLEEHVSMGRAHAAIETEGGLLGTRIAPLSIRTVDGALRFEISPHMSLSGSDDPEPIGGPRWEITS